MVSLWNDIEALNHSITGLLLLGFAGLSTGRTGGFARALSDDRKV